MQKLLINGGSKLHGELNVHGAKNSALPLLAATILGTTQSTLKNCPKLSDVDAACRILSSLGCKCTRENDSVTVDTSNLTHFDVPDELMKELRSSIVFLGAIMGRLGRCKLTFPGGCNLGLRPIDLHLSALRQMGITIKEDHGFLDCYAKNGINGAKIVLSFPSVGATENIMLAAVTAKGDTEIHNAAKEPEILDLADFLIKCGAKIKGAGESTIYISGVESISGCEHQVIPDRIVAVTYLCCAAITNGEAMLHKVNYNDISSIIPVLEQMGCSIYTLDNSRIYINAKKPLKPVQTIRTMPYPGFPTDAQALLMAVCTVAKGTSVFVENIFESRYKHVSELNRMGADIRLADSRVAVVEGVSSLSGASVDATDLRGGGALVIAGLRAEGVTEISKIYHIDRGYEAIEKSLTVLGADIKRINTINKKGI